MDRGTCPWRFPKDGNILKQQLSSPRGRAPTAANTPASAPTRFSSPLDLRVTLQYIATAQVLVLVDLPACESIVEDPHRIKSASTRAVAIPMTVAMSVLVSMSTVATALHFAAPIATRAVSTMLQARANSDDCPDECYEDKQAETPLTLVIFAFHVDSSSIGDPDHTLALARSHEQGQRSLAGSHNSSASRRRRLPLLRAGHGYASPML